MGITDFSDLKGKNCAVTGGAGVIGKALIEALSGAGVNTAILDLDAKAAGALAREMTGRYPVRSVGIEANVLDRKSLEQARTAVNESLGAVELLINGAGGNAPGATTGMEILTTETVDRLKESFFGLDMDGFDKVFSLNFNGTVLPTMVLAEDMVRAGKGAILNISSMNALKPLTKIPAYSAAKASVNNFTEWLAVHLARTGVRVNGIAPGFFMTQQNRFLLVDEKSGDLTDRGRKIIDNTPMGRFGETEELQGTVLFLLSDVSRFVTGIVIPVDGGFNAFGGV